MSEEHRPLSPDTTAVKSLSAQTNLHHVSFILSPHTHTAAPQETRSSKTHYFQYSFAARLFTSAATSTQNLLLLIMTEQTIGESVLDNTLCRQMVIIYCPEKSIKIYICIKALCITVDTQMILSTPVRSSAATGSWLACRNVCAFNGLYLY